MRDGGKGDRPRPLAVTLEEFDNKWETIFGKKTDKEQPPVDSIKLEDKEDKSK
jgi:hypothetical protein